jgi:hypothetical protein
MSDYHEGLEEGIKIGMAEAADEIEKLRAGRDKADDEIEELRTAVQYAIKLLDDDLSMAAQKFLLKALGEKG